MEPDFTLAPCRDRLYALEPGGSAPTFRVLPAGLAAGSCRLSTVVRAGTGMDRAARSVRGRSPCGAETGAG